MSTDVADRLNAALSGRYHIERELGQGGMATVYLADDIKNERKVALKVLKPQLAAVVGAERFLAEIKTTANLIYFEGSSVEELEASMARAVDQYLGRLREARRGARKAFLRPDPDPYRVGAPSKAFGGCRDLRHESQ